MTYVNRLKLALLSNFEHHLNSDFESDSETISKVSEIGMGSMVTLQLLPQKRTLDVHQCYLPAVVNPTSVIEHIDQIGYICTPPVSQRDTLYECKLCKQEFQTGQALGGHVSRKHPGRSVEYLNKKRIRDGRETERAILNLAKIKFYKSIGLDFLVLKGTKTGMEILRKSLNRTKLKQIKKEFKLLSAKA